MNNLTKTIIFSGVALGVAFFLFYKLPPTEPLLEPINRLTTQDLKPEPQTTTLFFAGDIMLSRNVGDKMIKANDYTLPFQKVAEVIRNADISFANLESPFLDKPPYAQQGLVFKADPKSVEGLKYAGFDVLSTANNHTLDQGLKGLDFTFDLLNQNNIIPSGTKKTDGGIAPLFVRHNDTLFSFLSYSYTALNDGGKSKSPYINDYNDLENLKYDIWGIQGHVADVVIVSMHAGTEYTREPTPEQIEFAHAAIDAGALMVIGHHPHWIQTIEIYKDRPIFYSLGNFVFDQMWSQDTKEGLAVLVTYESLHIPDPTNETAGETRSGIKKIELMPVIIEDYCCPRWANPDETQAILGKINLTDVILVDKN